MEEFYLDIQYFVKIGFFTYPLPANALGVAGTPSVISVTTTEPQSAALSGHIEPMEATIDTKATVASGEYEANVNEVSPASANVIELSSGEALGEASNTVVYVAVNNAAEAMELSGKANELSLRIKGSKVGICKVSYKQPQVKVRYERRKVSVSIKTNEGMKVGGIVVPSGSTVKLRAEFYDFDGSPRDPEQVILKVYDSNERMVGAQIVVPESNRVDVGVYEYPYTVPAGLTDLVYEFTGIIEGNPSIGRGILKRTFGV